MKRIATILLMFTFLLTGCSSLYTEADLRSEWDAGYEEGFEDGEEFGQDKGFDEGYDTGYADALYDYGLAEIEEYCSFYPEEPIAEPEPEPEFEVSTDSGDSAEEIVYITDTGEKYHRDGCNSLWKSQYELTLSEVVSQGYTPCKNCSPPSK